MIKSTRRLFVLFAVASLIATCSYSASAQGIFSGQGVPDFSGRTKSNTNAANESLLESSPLQNLFNRQRTDSERKPLTFPKLGLFKNSEPKFGLDYNDSSRPKIFEGFPRLFPPRPEGRPNFLTDLSDRTKSIFNRSNNEMSSWAKRAETVRDRTFETWENLTRGFKNPLSRSSSSPLTQPPVRSAQRAAEGSGIRF